MLVRVGFDALDPRILPDMGVKVRFLREEAAAGAAGAAPARGTVLVPKTAIKTDRHRDGGFRDRGARSSSSVP